ncbi:TolB family protein [Mucilaginibacter ginkgonis]|uniref:TolB family protein n=1 Tax=Mucilaginibacter ginkgonis TaxID=2682091 RepID=A0A6I4IP03_9SPHI|nr:PD40 domain-containing protein [Mucilaginibacter ginkgonis]QQL50680.1 TolB family protein [Mucilaginibacter ginkgonis]
MTTIFRCLAAGIVAVASFQTRSFAQGPGIFDGQSDIGAVKHPGTVVYHPREQNYVIAGSGANVWANADEFHFVWKKMHGDFLLRMTGAFVNKTKEEHSKWGWMIRTSLDKASAHVSAVAHANGLTSMQYRKTAGAVTEEMQSKINGADVIQLERIGGVFIMSVARNGETFTTDTLRSVSLNDDVYAGLFVCAHNAANVETAEFNNVRIVVPANKNMTGYQKYIGSDIEILDTWNKTSRIIYQSDKSIQAPNWTADNKSLIYNKDGLLYKYNLATNVPAVLNTGTVNQNNNDHVISFDNKWLTISSSTAGSDGSIGWVVPINGGEPRRITPIGPSYMHGWSPDGKYLVFTGMRNKDFDVYRVPVAGGEEVRLTDTKGLDDGPEYTPDGKYIYFNSVRTGLMQIWRMKPDGSEQTQITHDEFNNWFPHISPDGKNIVFVTFLKNEVAAGDHPFYKHVYLRMMPINGGEPKVVAYLYGGQGTINTPSWAPDSRHLAFVSNSSLLFPTFPIEK